MYRVTFRKRAAKEYIQSIAWYKERSVLAAENFVKAVNEAFSKIENEPEYFRNSYKHFHECKLRKYPHLLIYFIDDSKQLIVVTSIFHQKRNPKKKFGK